MFKAIIASLLIASCALDGFAQKNDSLQTVAKQREYLEIYRKALQYDDMPSAAYALTNYLIHGGQSNFRDTLAVVYYRSGNASGAYKLAREINEGDPKDITALTLLADISGRAGDTKGSLEWYEKLCQLAPEPYNYYQLATRQFVLERIGECKGSLTKVVADSVKARKEMVSLEVGPGNNENVPVLAAAYNMLGALAFRDKKTEEAKKYYELAVKEYPEFVIARQNLEGMKPKPAGKTGAVPKPKS